MPRRTTHAVDKASAPPEPAMPAAEELSPQVEAVLLSADRPTPASRVAEALGLLPRPIAEGEGTLPPASEGLVRAAEGAVTRAVAHLNAAYEATGRTFRIEAVAGGLRVMTLPQFASVVAEFHAQRQSAKLSRAAIETLAIIAYKQPITRAELEAIRGVACGEVIRTLVDRRLVTAKGRAEELGRPTLYGTTRLFLDTFGLASIKDLPTIGELRPDMPATAMPRATGPVATPAPETGHGETHAEPERT